MKKKGLISLFILMFGLFSTLGAVNLQKSQGVASASTLSSDLIWDGSYNSSYDSSDFYIPQDGNSVYIYTAKGLAHFASTLNGNSVTQYNGKTVYLESNIDLDNNEWKPIGFEASRGFNGTFDGQGHYIYNMKISTSYTYAGFFGFVGNGGVIQNLNLRGINITSGSSDIGGVVGKAATTGASTPVVLENCSAQGEIKIKTGNTNVGGVVGSVMSTNKTYNTYTVNSKVKNLKSSVTIEATDSSNTGGVVGFFNGAQMEGAGFDGSIESGGNVGGVVGLLAASTQSVTLSKLYNTGNLVGVGSANAKIGGVIGKSETNEPGNIMSYLYNAGSITGNYGYASGLVGYFNAVGRHTIQNAYSVNGVNATGMSSFGENESHKVNHLFFEADDVVTLEHVYHAGKISEGYALKDLEDWTKTEGFYSSDSLWSSAWDMTNTWEIISGVNGSYPCLRSLGAMFGADTYYGTTKENGFVGQGTETSPYLIFTAGDLALIADNVNDGKLTTAHFSLQNDIDLSGRAWTPIGKNNNGKRFAGVFDGNNHTISGITSSLINGVSSQFGLFGCTSNAVIKNVIVDNVKYLTDTAQTVSGSESCSTGAIIGYVHGMTFLVNSVCLDADSSPIGEGGGDKVVVFYGENNVKHKSANYGLGQQEGKGYVLTLDFKGGKIFDAEGNMITGKYEVLFELNGGAYSLLQQSVRTYKNLAIGGARHPLPQRTDGVLTYGYVVREGYRLKDYVVSGSAKDISINSFSINESNLKIYAEYDRRDVVINVFYNKYEEACFNPDVTEGTSKTKTVGYDEIISEVWPDAISNIERSGYDLKVMTQYSDKTFSGELFDDSKRLNASYAHPNGDNYELNLYCQWIGQTEREFSFTFDFKKGTDSSDDNAAYRMFNMTDALSGIKLQTFNESSSVEPIETWTGSWSGDKYIIKFSTKYSDLETNWFQPYFEVNEGYKVTAIHGDAVSYGMFGTIGEKDFSLGDGLSLKDIFNGTEENGNQNMLQYKNLASDYTLSVTAVREKHTAAVKITGNLLLGIGPKLSATTTKRVSIDVDNVPLVAMDRSALVAFDVVLESNLRKVYVLDTTTTLVEGEVGSITGSVLRITITIAGETHYYLLKIDQISTTVVQTSLYEANSSWTITDTLVRLHKEQDNNYIEYFHNSSFIILAQVIDTNEEIRNISYRMRNSHNVDLPSTVYEGKIIEVSGREYKAQSTFANSVEFYNNPPLAFSCELTSAIINAVVLVDENGNQIEENAPTISGLGYSYTANESLSFYVNPTLYYRFKTFEEGLKSYTQDAESGSWNIKVIENGSGVEQIVEVNGTFSTETGSLNRLTISGGLPIGVYQVYLVCEEITYSVSTGIKQDGAVSNTDFYSFEIKVAQSKEKAEQAEPEFYDYNANFEHGAYVVITATGRNNGNVSLDWRLSKDSKNIVLQTINSDETKTTYGFYYKDLYDLAVKNGIINEWDSSYTVYLNYTKKTLSVQLYSGYVYDDEAGAVNNLGVYATSFTNKAGITVDTDSANMKGLGFGTLEGSNKVGYFYVGYIIYVNVSSNTPIMLDKKEELYNSFDLSELLERMADKEIGTEWAGETKRTMVYYILPYVQRKNIKVNFYSGTGNVNTSYSDGRNGTVYDDEDNIVTDDVVTTYVTFGNSVVINAITIDGEDGTRDLNSYFASRKGYSKPTDNYLAYNYGVSRRTISGTEIYLEASTVSNGTVLSDTEIELNYYYIWTANTYNIALDTRGGDFVNGDNAVVSVTYESFVDRFPVVARTGYTFDGWAWNKSEEEVLIADSTRSFFDTELITDGYYIYTANVSLYAKWNANPYTVRVYKNSAETYYKNGIEVSAEDQTANYEDYTIYYDQDISSVLADYSNDKVPTRTGFEFVGLYADGTEMAQSNLLDGEMILNTNNSLVDLEAEVVLTAYVGWEFVQTYSITFENNIEGSVYTAENQTISIGEYLNTEVAPEGFVASYDAGTFVISAGDTANVSLATYVNEHEGTTFTVRNAGAYTNTLSIIIMDEAEYLNLGQLVELTFYLNYTVEQAEIDTARSVNERKLQLANMKQIMMPLVDEQERTTINGKNTFEDLISYLKSNESALSSVSDDDIYKYIMVKFYKQITNTDYLTYKNWTYADYQAYLADIENNNVAEVESIIDNLRFFSFYIFGENSSTRTINYYNSILALQSVDSTVSAENLANEIHLDKVVIETGSSEIFPNSFTALKFYVSNNDSEVLSNYNLGIDADGSKYLEIKMIYILPQVFHAEKSEEILYSYYDNRLASVNIDWSYGKESITFDNEKYYKIAEKLYMSATLTTSNIGDPEVDIEYTAYDKHNVLYYTNVSVLYQESADTIYDYTTYFKVLSGEDDVFTIMNIKNIAEITVTAQYLTENSGSMRLSAIEDSMIENLLRFTKVSYYTGSDTAGQNDESKWSVMSDDNYIKEGTYRASEGGVLLFEVRKNNANTISILLSPVVKKISVVTTANTIGNYVKLFKWAREMTYNIDGTMENNGSYDIYTNDITFVEDSKTEISLYAVYTDLVYVSYNLGFPEGYHTTSVKQSILKLGESTVDNLYMPYEAGFTLAELKAQDTTSSGINYTIDYTELFDESTGRFVGVSSTAPHTQVKLRAYWDIDDIAYTQMRSSIKRPAGNFNTLLANEVVKITNLNENLFDYEYSWSLNDVVLFETGTLRFEKGGVSSESGTYKLKVVAKIKDAYKDVVTESGSSKSIEVSVDCTFFASKIMNVSLGGVNTAVYNSQSHMQDWSLIVQYSYYDESLDAYSNDTANASVFYNTTGSLSATVKQGLEEVSSMINVGTYSIKLNNETDYYVLNSPSVQTEFEFTMTPFVLDIAQFNTDLSKLFDATEDELVETVYSGFEDVDILFVRDSGEDVGTYNMYVHDIVSENRNNYILKYNDTVVFEDLVADETVVVGEFTITTAGILKLYYQTTSSVSEIIDEVYDEDGYTISMTNNFVLQISQGSNILHQLTLVLYDVENEKIVSDSEIINLLRAQVSDLSIYFNNGANLTTAVDGGSYVYNFVAGENITKYFTTITFENGYHFVIGKQTININLLSLNKTFDGSAVRYFDTDLNILPAVDSETEVYIKAQYESYYANSSVKVNLSIEGSNVTRVSNYQLSATSTTAQISKLDATATLTMTESSYVYGTIKTTNFESFINPFTLMANGQNVTGLMEQGRYSLSYALSASSNENGVVYAGEYSVTATASFDDFNVTITQPTFTITKLQVYPTLTEGQFRQVITYATVGPHTQTFNVAASGDVLTLDFYADVSSASEFVAEHFYDVVLNQTYYANNSIEVIVESGNRAIEILADTDIIYLKLSDETVLTKEYNGTAFDLAVDLAGLKLRVTNGATTYTSNITFWKDDAQITISDLTQLSIYNAKTVDGESQEITSFETVGSYSLTLKTRSTTYPSILLESMKYFTITKRTVDATALTISKEYNGTNTLEIDSFAEKVSEDDVLVIATYADASVGTGKSVTLALAGDDSANYQLSANAVSGEISKKSARVIISQAEYVYGQFSKHDNIFFEVKDGDNVISSSEYNISFDVIADPSKYVGTWEYLSCGSYTLEMSGSADNYNLSFDNTQKLSIVQYAIDIVFETSGKYVVEYGEAESKTNTFTYVYRTPLFEDLTIQVTRENGVEIGFYKALSATTTNTNYRINSTTDSSSGVFRIIKSTKVVYILLTNAETISSSVRESVSTEFDGNDYSSILFENNSGNYSLQFTDGINTKSFNLYTYMLDGSTYTRQTVTLQNVTASFRFLDYASVRNVGTYAFYVENASATNYEIAFRTEGQVYADLVIGKKEIYFKDAVLTKVFNNDDATLSYEDARDVIDGIAIGDEVGISLSFMKESNVAKYVGINYSIVAELSGEELTLNNYILMTTTSDGTIVTGQITKADLTLYIMSKSYVYGATVDTSELYAYTTDVDLTGYDTTRMSISLSLNAPAYSTSGKLKVGEYYLLCNCTMQDFNVTYNVNGRESETYGENAKVTITSKKTDYTAVSGTLQDLFTKVYDGTTDCTTSDGGSSLLLLGDVYDGDVVSIAGATYASADVGETIEVRLVLGGSDAGNYYVENWSYGKIVPIMVSLRFDYNANGSSSVYSNNEISGIKTITKLAFPFVSQSYLTANSYESDTIYLQNFPTSLSGYTGFTFAVWTLRFENVSSGTVKYNYLLDLVEELKMEYEYEDQTFAIHVGNNPNTVILLNKLMKEDTENVCGMYYKETDTPIVTFTAAWNPVEYVVQVRVADENGRTAEYGSVDVDGTVITRIGQVSYGYGDVVTIVATPAQHARYYGSYNADDGTRYDTTPAEYIELSRSGNITTLTITQMTTSYNFVIRFIPQSITTEIDTTNAQGTISTRTDVVEETNKLTWTTNYFNLDDITLADLCLQRPGYEIISLSDGTNIYQQADFGAVYIKDLVDEIGELYANTTLSLSPEFESVGVPVTLDYGFDNIKNIITVNFDSKYNTSPDWVETPERTGYIFGGWFTDGGERIYGETDMLLTEEHTLTADWTIASFNLSLTAENLTMRIGGEVVDEFAQEVDFGTTLLIVLEADDGYALPSSLPEMFASVVNGNLLNVTLTMPGNDLDYTFRAVANANTFETTGQHIESVVAFDITDGTENPIAVSENVFTIETGKDVKVVVTAEEGYIIDSYALSEEDLVVDETNENGVLTLVISGIKSDVSLSVVAIQGKHTINLVFDDESKIETFMLTNGSSYDRYFEFDSFEVLLGENLEFNLKYVHGYKLMSCTTESGYTIETTEREIGSEIYTVVSVSNIESDGEINLTTELQKYTLSLEVVSYDENKNIVTEDANSAIIRENGTRTFVGSYGREVTLLATTTNQIYSFAGWSKDGINIFETESTFVYAIDDDETIFAIFSAIKFDITFGTLEYYTLYGEYSDATKLERHYEEISGLGEGYYEDADMTLQVSGVSIYYGSSRDVYYKTPAGYGFYGFGYKEGNDFVYISRDDNGTNMINISTLDLDENNTTVKIYIVVQALTSKIELNTFVDIGGDEEENVNVGSVKLVDKDGNNVNEYGYVDGTRVHYSPSSFTGIDTVSKKHFDIIASTGETVYLKITIDRVGYRLYNIVSDNDNVTIDLVSENDGAYIYKVSRFTGGENLEVKVLFRPNLNKILVDFVSGTKSVDGGAFSYTADDPRKVFSSGKGYSTIEVSAYTDSSFVVYAYVHMGFDVDENDIQIVDESGIVDLTTVTYQTMDAITTGYSALVTFKVEDYLGENNISLKIIPKTYTVKFIEEGTTLVTIKNVQYGSFIDLAQTNASNITISSEKIMFAGGRLNLKLGKQGYTFEGFFSYENGAGVRYINSEGFVTLAWAETGYYYDLATATYKTSTNATVDADTGEITVSLFLYWSYLKTRITFTITPSDATGATAQDMITGIDYTNSWFYKSAPYYIEVAFNTTIKINAPEIEGYTFYKFIVEEKDKQGNWRPQAESYSSSIPWETNELDSVVECNIQIIYFAQVDVVIYGGEGTYAVEQDIDDAQAQKLIQDGYVDTRQPFTLVALPDDGYIFTRWNNITAGRSSASEEWEGLTISSKTTFIMNLQGDYVTLRFTDIGASGTETPYDTTFGRIIRATAVSINNTTKKNYVIGSYNRDVFKIVLNEIEVKVGDIVTFAVEIDYGFAAIWNISEMSYTGYSDGYYMFELAITADMCVDDFVRVLPSFKNEILSIYVKRDFVEEQKGLGAIDADNVDLAGSVSFGGRKTDRITAQRGLDVLIGVRPNDRYEVVELYVVAGAHEIDLTQYYARGVVTLLHETIEEREIIGTLQLVVKFGRLLWEEENITTSIEGEGTSRNPYEISTVEELTFFMQKINSGAKNIYGKYYYNANYVLMNDLDLGKEFWTPIGTMQHAFNGYFNFNNKEIKAIYNPFVYEYISYNGLFGVLGEKAVIEGGQAATWYWYLIGVAVLALITTVIVLILVARKNKARREQMERK